MIFREIFAGRRHPAWRSTASPFSLANCENSSHLRATLQEGGARLRRALTAAKGGASKASIAACDADERQEQPRMKHGPTRSNDGPLRKAGREEARFLNSCLPALLIQPPSVCGPCFTRSQRMMTARRAQPVEVAFHRYSFGIGMERSGTRLPRSLVSGAVALSIPISLVLFCGFTSARSEKPHPPSCRRGACRRNSPNEFSRRKPASPAPPPSGRCAE